MPAVADRVPAVADRVPTGTGPLTVLRARYFDPKTGLTDLNTFLRAQQPFLTRHNITHRQAEDAIKNDPTRTLFAPQPRDFPRVKIYANEADALWHADLMDTGSLDPKENKNTHFLLILVDVYSRFTRAIPLPSKSGPDVAAAFAKLVRTPKRLHVDDGREFFNKPVEAWGEKHAVRLYASHSQVGAPMAERFIRTLRRRIALYRQERHDVRWINALPAMVSLYNDTPHSTTHEKPADLYGPPLDPDGATKATRRIVNFPEPETKETTKPLPVGTPVRILMERLQFQKENAYPWSREVYWIAHILPTNPRTYVLADFKNQILEGSFYRQELQPTHEQETFDVEILDRRTVKGVKQVLVRWRGYEALEPEWIPALQVSQPS